MKPKILDSFFFYDEVDLLYFRLEELWDKVDFFIIIESDKDFSGNSKVSQFQENQKKFEKFKDKILNLNCSISNNKKGVEIQKECLIQFCEFISQMELDFVDIIMLSHVDEIPNLNKIENIVSLLNTGPVTLKQSEYFWSLKGYHHNFHYGTKIIDFSKFLTFRFNFFMNQNALRNKFSTLDCGWHFSHFQTVEKLKNKFTLLSELKSQPENLEFLIENNLSPTFPHIFLKEIEIELPKNLHLIPNHDFRRKIPKKFEICTKNYKNDFLVPNKILYDDILERNFNFQEIFFLNEVKSKLLEHYPINEDSFLFLEYNKTLKWSEIKNNFLSDLLLN